MVCCSKGFLEFLNAGYGYAVPVTRVCVKSANLLKMRDFMCRDGELVLAARFEGFSHGVAFDVKGQNISMYELLDGMPWPVGCGLSMRSEQERPGSFVVNLRMPIGGRSLPKCGPAFMAYAVRVDDVEFCMWFWYF